MTTWAARSARARLLAKRYPAAGEILLFYAGLAEWQGQAALRQATPEALLPELAELVRRTGPPALRQAAEGLTRLPELDAPAPLSFFALACRQPHAKPCVTCTPQAGCLIRQGEGQALELVCSLCFSRRHTTRAQCPGCGENRDGRLVFYSAAEFPHLKLQVCENCQGYFQLVDLSVEPEAIPEVDELAGLPLDLWAQEQGYHKLHPNLAGI